MKTKEAFKIVLDAATQFGEEIENEGFFQKNGHVPTTELIEAISVVEDYERKDVR